MIPQSHLPPRFREVAFRRYEDTLARVVQGYPAPIKVELADIAPTTIESRLRDAATAYFKYNYHSDAFSPEDLRAVWSKCVVRIRDGAVYVEPREAQALEPTKPKVEGATWTEDELRAVMLLMSGGKILERVAVGGVKHDLLQDLAEQYNVAVVVEDGVTYLF